MHGGTVMSCQPLLYGGSRLQKDIFGDVAVIREAGMLRSGLAMFLELLRRIKRSFPAGPKLIERHIGPHNLYLWQMDSKKVWEGRNIL